MKKSFSLLSPLIDPKDLGQFCPLIAAELTLLRRGEITAIEASLAKQLGQSAVEESLTMGHGRTAVALTETKGYSLNLVLHRKLAAAHGRHGYRKAFSRSWRDAYRLTHEIGATPIHG